MNVVEFVLVRPQRKITLVNIHIDGRTLIDLAREHEMPFAEREGHPNIAGKYRGVDAPSVCEAALAAVSAPRT